MYKKKYCCKFCKTYSMSTVSYKRTIYTLDENLQSFSAGNTRTWKHYVLTEEIVNDTGAWMDTSPKKCLCLLTSQIEVSKASAHMTTQFLKLQVYKLTAKQQIFPTDQAVRHWYCRRLGTLIDNRLLYPELVSFLEPWFTANENINRQNTILMFWSSQCSSKHTFTRA